MTNLLQLSGKIDVNLVWNQGVIESVTLSNSRPQQMTQYFIGKSLHDVLNLIPLLYNLCGVAQQVAAVRAVESALQINVAPGVEAARNLLVQAEVARELGFRLLTAWLPGKAQVNQALCHWFSGVKQQLGRVLQLQVTPSAEPVTIDYQHHAEALQQILNQVFDIGLSQPVVQPEIDVLLDALIAQMKPEQALLFSEQSPLTLNQPAPGLEEKLVTGTGWICEQLQNKGDQFSALPEIDGQCYETSAWSRQNGSTDVDPGNNLLRSRLAAIAQQLMSLPAGISSQAYNHVFRVSEPGYSVVEAARGMLIHHVAVAGNSIADLSVTDYKIVAPTEWNFHPQGTLVQMLEGVAVSKNDLTPLVESLILLVDPCVNWQLNVDIRNA